VAEHVRPEDMTAEQRAEWEEMNAGGLFPEGLPDPASFAGAGSKPHRPPFRPSHLEGEELRRLDDRHCYHRDKMLEAIRERLDLEEEELTEAATTRRRVELQRELERHEAGIAKLRAKKLALQAEIRGVGRGMNQARINDARLKGARLEERRHERKMLEARQKLIDLLASLNAPDSEYLNFLGKTRDQLV